MKKERLLTHNAVLVVVTLMAMASVTVLEAFAPSTTSHSARSGQCAVVNQARKRRRNPLTSRLKATVTPIEDDTDLYSSLPVMSAEIKQQSSSRIRNKNERRKRRRKQNEINSESGTPKTNSSKKNLQNKKASTNKRGDDYTSDELLGSIPKLSDILEGRATFDQAREEKNTNKSQHKIKIISNNPKKRNTATKQQTSSPAVAPSTKSSPDPSAQALLPWRANFKTSKRTQGRIQKAFVESKPWARDSHSRAKSVLDTLLETPPQYCNAVNLVCALTYSAKAMGNRRVGKNLDFRKSLQETFDILYDLLVVHRDEGLFSPRQLCNVAWAIAKHVDRDPDLLPSKADKDNNSPEFRLEQTIDEIAGQLTSILYEDDENDGDVDTDSGTTSKRIKSSFQQPEIKLGEICMACWAYGKLRPREIPPGWPGPPQMGAVKNRKSIVTDWKTEQLGKSSASDFKNNDGNDEKIAISGTDKLFDAIGHALCQSGVGDRRGDMTMVEDCTWSELANVGWAFASHGRCRSTESESVLQAIAHEAASRLKYGTIANNSNHQDFLVRDVTQLLWSLGTLQSDNFRLADDLVFLIEALTTNLRLGEKTRSSFAQGRPLRRWSCADLVQTAVALAHARIDENLLLRAIYEEGNYRLMEGASSSRKLSSLTTLPSEKKSNNLPIGESRRTFHPWEASILLWAQARLFLTEQEGVEFDEFVEDAPLFFLKALRESRGSFAESKIGPQEQANIVWSLVILEKYESPEAIILIDLIFAEAARSCKENKSMQLEHAHQLWQAYFMLEEDCPEAVKRVPEWFVSYLKEKWTLEKARDKLSSARHKSLSSTLQLMGVNHINEHDEDIDVAIILQPNAVWVHETNMDEDEIYESGSDGEDHVSVAVEFDGPNHFTRIRTESQQIPGTTRHAVEPPRALGHTVLKYRLLKKQGWTVIRVPYYEFDKIPFWASMERQRYLQRKLKTHANIQFSEVDVSEYKTLTHNRKSRFD
jgi:hypothetical protein